MHGQACPAATAVVATLAAAAFVAVTSAVAVAIVVAAIFAATAVISELDIGQNIQAINPSISQVKHRTSNNEKSFHLDCDIIVLI